MPRVVPKLQKRHIRFPDISAKEMRVLRLIEKPLWVVLATFGMKVGIPVSDFPEEKKDSGMFAQRLQSRTSPQRR